MNSESVVFLAASGKCQGELYVSVNARCCSAMTRREIRWQILAMDLELLVRGLYCAKYGVHKFIHIVGFHEVSAF